jgi:hypothetical protein
MQFEPSKRRKLSKREREARRLAHEQRMAERRAAFEAARHAAAQTSEGHNGYDPYSTAIHEAAHAIVACRLGRGLRKKGVTIIPVPYVTKLADCGGVCFSRGHGSHWFKNDEQSKAEDRQHQESKIMELFAGGMAEYRISKTAGTAGDSLGILRLTRNYLYDTFNDQKPLVHAADLLWRRDKKIPDLTIDVLNACRRAVGRPELTHAEKDTFLKKQRRDADADKLIKNFSTVVWILSQYRTAVDALRSFTPEYAIELAQTDWFHVLGPLAERTQVFLDENWADVERLGAELLRRKAMTGPEVHEFLEFRPKVRRATIKPLSSATQGGVAA